jgi:serine/threonine protein kinase
MQFRELQDIGIDPFNDLKQLIFTGVQQKVVDGVLDGKFQAGFVRTDQLERSIDIRTNKPLDLSAIKFIGLRNDTKETGDEFPFPRSTRLYPEWNFASFSHTPTAVVAAAQASLLQMIDHAAVGAKLLSCYEENLCDEHTDISASIQCKDECWGALDWSQLPTCDTVPEVAITAYQAMSNGKYTAWIPSLSYADMRSIIEELSLVQRIDLGDGTKKTTCVRASSIADSVVCPEGFYKVSDEEIATGCSQADLDCFDYQCVCSPCVPIPVDDDGMDPYMFALCIAVPAIAVIGLVLCFYEHKRRQENAIWTIPQEDIIFDDPPHELGRGSFGCVLQAEYNGTHVAVKRLDPSKFNIHGSSSRKSKNSLLTSSSRSKEQAPSTKKDEDMRKLEAGLRKRGYVKKASKSFGNTSLRVPKIGIGSRAVPIKSRGKVQMQKDFIEEMKLLTKLRHPCITTIIGGVLSPTEGDMIVMEMMEMGSLYDILHNQTMVLDGEVVLTILRDVISGLRFLHASKPQLIHCDLKARNVLVDAKLRAKVSDFGLSGGVELLSCSGGTPFWMAPELLRNDTGNTTASDMYSFGVLLYEIFSRKIPYEDDDHLGATEILKQIADPLVSKRPTVPKKCPTEFKEIMTACWRDDPLQRPTAEEIDIRIKMMDTTDTNSSSDGSGNNVLRHHAPLGAHAKHIPPRLLKALQAGEELKPETHDAATVLFLSLSNFSNLATQLSAEKFSNLLHRLHKQLDKICKEYDLFRVETVQESYLVCANVATSLDNHIVRTARFAVDALDASESILVDPEAPALGHAMIQIGVHTGPVTSHVVGTSTPRFSIMGDVVSKAGRMESTSASGKIHCTKAIADGLQDFNEFRLVDRLSEEEEVPGKRKVSFHETPSSSNSFWLTPTMTAEERRIKKERRQYVKERIAELRRSSQKDGLGHSSPAMAA